MFTISISLIILSTAILLFIIPVFLDKRIEDQESKVSERLINFYRIKNAHDDIGPSRTLFIIVQNQLKIFQRTKDDSEQFKSNSIEMFKEVEKFKKTSCKFGTKYFAEY